MEKNKIGVGTIRKDKVLTFFEVSLWGTMVMVPLLLPGPQLVVGSVINMALVVGAMRLDQKRWWMMVILPSLTVMMRGVLFGSLTSFLIYFLPMIWLGNWVLMKVICLLERRAWWERMLVASLAKMLILWMGASLYFSLEIVPLMFVTAMGVMQGITAVLGGVGAQLILKNTK